MKGAAWVLVGLVLLMIVGAINVDSARLAVWGVQTSGTVVGSVDCPKGGCFARVEYEVRSGPVRVVSIEVPHGTTRGDSVSVRYERGNPTNATAEPVWSVGAGIVVQSVMLSFFALVLSCG